MRITSITKLALGGNSTELAIYEDPENPGTYLAKGIDVNYEAQGSTWNKAFSNFVLGILRIQEDHPEKSFIKACGPASEDSLYAIRLRKKKRALMPCPFCGSDARHKQSGEGRIVVECLTCKARSREVLGSLDHSDIGAGLATFAWNGRYEASMTESI